MVNLKPQTKREAVISALGSDDNVVYHSPAGYLDLLNSIKPEFRITYSKLANVGITALVDNFSGEDPVIHVLGLPDEAFGRNP